MFGDVPTTNALLRPLPAYHRPVTSPTSPPQPSPPQPTPPYEPEVVEQPTRRTVPSRPVLWGGALVSAVVGLGLLTRYGLHGALGRDEAIYAYSGQLAAHGIPPYSSMFDPKGPAASLLAGAAAAFADATGHNDLFAMRVLYLLFSVAAVVAVYFVATRVFSSVTGGLLAAVGMASFRGFSADALAGPDAKTPGVFLVVLCMLLLAQRRWAWGAFAGSLAFLVWQPYLFYPATAVLLALVLGRRVRAVVVTVLAAAAPLAAVAVYFAAVGALDRLVEATLVFPLEGIKRSGETVLDRMRLIATVVHDDYQLSGVLLWVGMAGLLVLVLVHLARHVDGWRAAFAHPLVSVVALTGLAEVGYALTDFQGYPDVFALLPYGALGIGGLAAAVVGLVPRGAGRRLADLVVVLTAAALAATSWVVFTHDQGEVTNFDHGGLVAQLSDACGVQRLAGPHGTVWALGDATPLVLTHRRNPDRFIYLGSGVDLWKIAHTPHGFSGWTDQIARVHPDVIVLNGWNSDTQKMMSSWLRHDAGYHRRYLGPWRVFVDRDGLDRARNLGIDLTKDRTDVAQGLDGRRLPPFRCR